jgi:hypothetical protein
MGTSGDQRVNTSEGFAADSLFFREYTGDIDADPV